jgi:hypothetical protein
MSTETEYAMNHGCGPTCAVCGNPLEIHDYSGEALSESHKVDLAIIASVGDTSLPYILEVHGNCLSGLRDMLYQKNKGLKWV